MWGETGELKVDICEIEEKADGVYADVFREPLYRDAGDCRTRLGVGDELGMSSSWSMFYMQIQYISSVVWHRHYKNEDTNHSIVIMALRFGYEPQHRALFCDRAAIVPVYSQTPGLRDPIFRQLTCANWQYFHRRMRRARQGIRDGVVEVPEGGTFLK